MKENLFNKKKPPKIPQTAINQQGKKEIYDNLDIYNDNWVNDGDFSDSPNDSSNFYENNTNQFLNKNKEYY